MLLRSGDRRLHSEMRDHLLPLKDGRHVNALRVLPFVVLALAACGSFSPSDEDEKPTTPPATNVDAAVDAAADDATPAKPPSSDAAASDARSDGDASSCVPGGQYANAEAACCSGAGKFEGFSGWLCSDSS